MGQPKPRFIYGLAEPDSGEVRYVGATTNTIKRLTAHLWHQKTRQQSVHNWVAKLAETSKQPMLCILEECDGDSWQERERYWIAHFRSRGNDLFNSDNGGAGARGLDVGQWSRDYDVCQDCGKTDLRHAAHGLCVRCWSRQHHRATMQPNRPYHDWSLDYAACVECGTTDRPHKGNGLCTNCFARQRRRMRASA